MKLENYKKMVELQHTLNIQTAGDNYLEKNLNWNSCIIAESGEMLDSLGYKWWAKCVSPLSEQLRLNYYYKDGNIFNRKTDLVINSRLDNGTGYLLSVNSDLCFDIGVSTIGLHRLVYMINYGDIPSCADVDHIDKNKLNNKIENLRLLSKRDNQINSLNVENAKGYYKKKNGKYHSQIRANGKKIYLGTFETENEAKISYESAKELYHQLNPIKANGFKNCIDLDNAKVEAIDLLHFVISEDLEDYKKDALCDTRFFMDWLADDFYYIFENSGLKLSFKDMDLIKVTDELNYKQIRRLDTLKEIFTKLEMTNEDVYIAYIVKNCLNKFRQDNGYKDGTYNKIWIDKEDNVVAYELAKNIGASEDLFDLLYADLDASYSYYFKSVKDDDNEYKILVSGLWQITNKQMYESTDLPKALNGVEQNSNNNTIGCKIGIEWGTLG